MKIYCIFHCNNVIALFPLVFDYTYKHGNQHKHEHDFTTSGFQSMRLNYLTKYCEPRTMSNSENKNCNCH